MCIMHIKRGTVWLTFITKFLRRNSDCHSVKNTNFKLYCELASNNQEADCCWN